MSCGATKADAHGPVIPMAPAPGVESVTKLIVNGVPNLEG